MHCNLVRMLLVAGWFLVFCPLAADGADNVAADERLLKDAKLSTDGPALLDFLRKRTVGSDVRDKVQVLIKQLGDDSFEVREKATADLIALGAVAEPLLRQALNNPDFEIKRRAEECLRRLDKQSSASLVMAVTRLIAVRKPVGAAEVLLAYLPAAEDEIVVDEVRTALAAVALRDSKAEPVLVAALTDKNSAQRAEAAAALCQAGAEDQRPAIRKLLGDPEPAVRLRVALALATVKEKEAIPVLINLLTEAPLEKARRVEDYLFRVAGDEAPKVSLGRDDAARKKCREAWAAWWKDHGAKIDVARLTNAVSRLGYTLVVHREKTGTAGRVVELDANGKVRWEIAGLQSPIDAQLLPGDRVLICEYTPKRITERNLKGEVLWEKKLATTQYLVTAQRLPNGNTFIACRNQIMELDEKGKEIISIKRAASDVYAAQKLRNGQIALITLQGVYTRLDATGKELQSFQVGRIAIYSGIDVLPSGGVIVPLTAENKVAEYDADGKRVWEVAVQSPMSAVRLPNGNILIASAVGQRIVEVDRTGKEVWEHRLDGRPYRAQRR